MRKLLVLFSFVALSTGYSLFAVCEHCLKTPKITNDIPIIETPFNSNWEKLPDAAMYKEADWSNVIGKAENVSMDEAARIAESDPRITFFFYVKGYQMVLENLQVKPEIWRVFHHGDAVFFTGSPSWGSAPGLADGYVKKVAK